MALKETWTLKAFDCLMTMIFFFATERQTDAEEQNVKVSLQVVRNKEVKMESSLTF